PRGRRSAPAERRSRPGRRPAAGGRPRFARWCLPRASLRTYTRAVGETILGAGRDAEIVDLGGGRVLRRPRRPRPLDGEALLMRHVAAAGYPAPAVLGVRPDGLVLERVEGATLLDDLRARPWQLRRHAR